MVDLERELRAAQALARDPRYASDFDFPNDIAGLGYVDIRSGIYQPDEGGEPAVIVAVETGGELIDLAAVRISDRATATRIGVATILGEDAVEAALLHDHTLLVYRDPLHWLQAGCLGVSILDWKAARWVLAGIPRITCATPDLEKRLRRAFTLPSHLPAFIPVGRAA